ncbi:7-carboxy-7-deazaguanine synthase [Luteibacter sp. HA06]
MYAVKEIFYTLQGEGAQAGSPAVFCRFAGCNLWSGREADRATSACTFCDTDFVGVDGEGGGKFTTTSALAYAIAALWPSLHTENRLVVFTGGEPLLQLDEPLLRAMHALGFRCAVETNGTMEPPAGIDWLTVSPKGRTTLKVSTADELKLVYPQADNAPHDFDSFRAKHYFLQPLDNADRIENTAATVDYCKRNPRWRLGLQTHKYLGIP